MEDLVSTGIRVYIGLIGCGEKVRSTRIFKDVLELSAMAAGGPSRLVELGTSGGTVTGPRHNGVVMATMQSLLSSVLVLRLTGYWQRIPELGELVRKCDAVSVVCGNNSETRDRRTSGTTSCQMNDSLTAYAGEACGCRRSNALPTLPTLSDPSNSPTAAESQQTPIG
jgi:hypothetical protein